MNNIEETKLKQLKATLEVINKKLKELEEIQKSIIRDIELLERDLEIVNLYD